MAIIGYSYWINAIPLSGLICFILLCLLIIWNLKNFSDILEDKSLFGFVVLASIFVFAAALRVSVPMRHVTFLDEFYYMDAAKRFLMGIPQDSIQKSIGWSAVLSAVYAVFGVDNRTAIISSIAMSALTVFPVFLMGAVMTKKFWAGLTAAFVYSILATSVFWAGTAENTSCSVFSIFLSMAAFFLYIRTLKPAALYLLVFSIAFATTVRPENFLYPLLFILGMRIYGVQIPRPQWKPLLAGAAVCALLILPNFMNVFLRYTGTEWITKETQGMASGPNWSLSNLVSNTVRFGPMVFVNKWHSILFPLSAAAGMGALFWKDRKSFWFLCLWLAGVILTLFTSWFQTFAGRSRFFLFFAMPLLIFAAMGLHAVSCSIRKRAPGATGIGLILAVTILFGFSFRPATLDGLYMDDDLILQASSIHNIKQAIPRNCESVSAEPLIFTSSSNLNTKKIDAFISGYKQSDAGRCAIFIEDIFCHISDIPDQCTPMFRNFSMQPFKIYTRGGDLFVLWKIMHRASDKDSELRIAASIPRQGQRNVNRNPENIILYFNRPLAPGFMNNKSLSLGGISGSFVPYTMNNVLGFHMLCLDQLLKPNTRYEIVVQEFNPEKPPPELDTYRLAFQTGDDIAPDGPPILAPGGERFDELCRITH